jgi:hypothetical protein
LWKAINIEPANPAMTDAKAQCIISWDASAKDKV